MEVDAVDQAEEAAFESVVNGTDLAPATHEQQKEQPETPPEEHAEAPEAKPLTVDDLKAMIEAQQAESVKTRDRLFGKIGDLQQKIDAAKVSASGLSPKARERLQADFPELAEMLFDGDDAPAEQAQPQHLSPPAPDYDVKDVIRREVEPLKLAVVHPDWESTVQSQSFNDWKGSVLSPEDAAELSETWDSKLVAKRITEFKNWQAAQAKQAADKTAKQKRLDLAVTPRGVPGDTSGYSDDDEEASMIASFGRK